MVVASEVVADAVWFICPNGAVVTNYFCCGKVEKSSIFFRNNKLNLTLISTGFFDFLWSEMRGVGDFLGLLMTSFPAHVNHNHCAINNRSFIT